MRNTNLERPMPYPLKEVAVMEANYETPGLATKTTHRAKESIINTDNLYRSVWGKMPDNENAEMDMNYSVPILTRPREINVEFGMHYTAEINGTDIELDAALNDIDKIVYGAIESIYLTAFEEFHETQVVMTASTIYRVLAADGGKKATPGKAAAQIDASIEKMRRIFMTVTPTGDLVEKYPKLKGVDINGPMLSAERIRDTVQGHHGVYWVINAMPILYRFSDRLDQVARVPLKYLRNPTRFTLEKCVIRQYLVRRIEAAKSYRKNGRDNGILYETMYEDILKTKSPTAKMREKFCAKVRDILDGFVENKYIDGYKLERGPRNSLRKISISIL